jgi:hypothetical protein
MTVGLPVPFDATDPGRSGAFRAGLLGDVEHAGELWVVPQDPDGNELCLQ